MGMKTITRKLFFCDRCGYPFDPILDADNPAKMQWIFHGHLCKDQWMDGFLKVAEYDKEQDDRL